MSNQDEQPIVIGAGNENEAEVVEESTKSLLLQLMSQIKIGMDLTRVPIPSTFLEPRSLLERLVDFLAHPQLICKAMEPEDPIQRFLEVVRWYVSGWHVKPKGVKKPYNPVLGEIFRCNYEFDDGSVFAYIGEQVSHHPPISAMYAEDRSTGLEMEGWFYPRSKFLGNSAASINEGNCKITFHTRDEVYHCTWPTIYCRGLLWGTLLMEYGGKITIDCPKNHLKAEIEFKTKGFFSGEYNAIVGKIKHKHTTLYTLRGKWNDVIYIKNNKDGVETEFFNPNVVERKFINTIDFDELDQNESRKKWTEVTKAIQQRDIDTATRYKNEIENEQRALRAEREKKKEEWTPSFFRKDGNNWRFFGHNDPRYTKLLTPLRPANNSQQNSTASAPASAPASAADGPSTSS